MKGLIIAHLLAICQQNWIFGYFWTEISLNWTEHVPSWLGVNASLMKVKLSCSSSYLSASFFSTTHKS